jgi:uncharacterized protein
MPNRTDVAFPGEGDLTLRGWLYVPSGQRPHLAISMCRGFAAVKEHRLDRYALALAEAGFVVPIHDHNNFGSSDGASRHDIDPRAQIADWRRTISVLDTRPEVDASRIGIWGSSFSGGHALVLAATDRSVKCVASLVPTISGFEQTRRRLSLVAMQGLLNSLTDDLRVQHGRAPPRAQAIDIRRARV